MQTGDTFEVREDHLKQAIDRKAKPGNFKICNDCLVSVAASDHFGSEISTSFGFIAKEDSERLNKEYFILKTNLIGLFDNEEYDAISKMLPLTLTIGELYADQD